MICKICKQQETDFSICDECYNEVVAERRHEQEDEWLEDDPDWDRNDFNDELYEEQFRTEELYDKWWRP